MGVPYGGPSQPVYAQPNYANYTNPPVSNSKLYIYSLDYVVILPNQGGCQFCGSLKALRTKRKTGTVTWLWCLTLSFCSCCCIPFCIDGCKDV